MDRKRWREAPHPDSAPAMVTLRPFAPDDLPALYAISLATGHRGGDASHLHQDPKLIGHIYSAPYALLDPGIALVAVDAEGVTGYAVGASDTTAWEAMLERRWWPALRCRYADPGDTPPATWTWDQRRAWMIHHPFSTPRAVVEAFPAHVHMNLAPRAQGQGVGRRLLAAWLDAAAAHGAGGVHVGVNAGNARGLRFWGREGFEVLTPDGVAAGRTVWMGRSQVSNGDVPL